MVTAMQHIAFNYFVSGNGKKGESIIQKALTVTKQASLSDNDDLVVASKVKLANALEEQDMLTDAKQLCISLLDSAWVYGCTMRNIYDIMVILFHVISRLEENDEMEMLYVTYRSSSKVENWLEAKSYEKLHLNVSYVSILGDLYRYNEAEQLLMDTLNESTRMYGDKNTFSAVIFRRLGDLHFKQGNHVKAENLHRQAYQIYAKYLGEDHIGTLSTNSHLGLALANCGRIVDGYQLVSRVLQQQMLFLDPDDSFVLNSLVNLAEIETKLGMYTNAAIHAKRALEGYGARQGIHRPAALRAMKSLAVLTPLPIEDKEDLSLKAGLSTLKEDELFMALPLPHRREPEIYKILLQPRLAMSYSKPLKVRRTHTHY